MQIPLGGIVRLDQERLRDTADEISRITADYFVARGIWVPLTDEEVAEIARQHVESYLEQ